MNVTKLKGVNQPKNLKNLTDMEGPPNWQAEADAVMQDIKHHVHRISISNIPSCKRRIYFNITTLEMKDFCVELTEAGFQIVGEKHDSQEKKGKYSVFETPYSMLDSLSPAYRDSFSEELLHKLQNLQRERGKPENSEDEG